jgi:DNA invertase Pin-like site-specific DNA recombinase
MAISSPVCKKAIAYYRHSAEDKQENSVPIQRAHAQKFAATYNVEIIHEEADEGKSGLSASRPGYEKLFSEWILNPDAPPFDYVFVYDVSRWGRFQDQDEAAYYEFRCKQRGKKVVYVSRGFPKEEEQLISHLQTSIERYMAAEYSRQLSEKVFYGCVKVSEQGYSAGGLPAYGMSRLLLDANKKPIKKLKKGEWKSISNERVTFTPAADETTAAVQEMFTLLVEKWESPKNIAEMMNSKGVPTAQGKKWKSQGILNILTNEVYTGTRVYNKTWGRLKQKHRINPRNEWVIQRDAFPHVVTADLFRDAQEHLYWLMPSKWRRGIYAIRRSAQNLQTEIVTLLLKKGLSVDEVYFKIKKLPVALGVCFYLNSVPHWCFIVKEHMKNYDYILGVSLAIDRREPVDRFFWIPINSFDATNFIIFSEADACYENFIIKREIVEEKILSLVK